eukprot:NODE_242_length_13076_cov_0.518379.p7 type:complete len:181 gc:universal NODE_242_length_13076_cov_0.518379:2762-2220(-)
MIPHGLVSILSHLPQLPVAMISALVVLISVVLFVGLMTAVFYIIQFFVFPKISTVDHLLQSRSPFALKNCTLQLILCVHPAYPSKQYYCSLFLIVYLLFVDSIWQLQILALRVLCQMTQYQCFYCYNCFLAVRSWYSMPLNNFYFHHRSSHHSALSFFHPELLFCNICYSYLTFLPHQYQ